MTIWYLKSYFFNLKKDEEVQQQFNDFEKLKTKKKYVKMFKHYFISNKHQMSNIDQKIKNTI